MATNLENKLNAILNEKKEKILPNNIRKGVTIFDIEGTLEILDTSDATALEEDIVQGKTAYVNNEKITGTVTEVPSNLIMRETNTKIYTNNGKVTFESGGVGDNFLLRTGATIQTPSTYANVASAIGLTAEKIAKGNNILGIEGTHEGGGESEYNATLDGKSTTIGSTQTFDIKKAITYIDEINFEGMTILGSALSELRNLIEIKKITNTSKVINMQNMFQNDIKITTIPEYDTSNNTTLYSTYYNCTSLINLAKQDASKVIDLRQAFYKCSNLTNFGGLINIGKAYTKAIAIYANYTIPIGIGTLTHDSLMNIINGLYDLNLSYNVANGGTLYTQQLTIGSTNLSKLTAEEIRNSNS